jgi:aminoglycoside phosphotransferase (APT) family kinase protein
MGNLPHRSTADIPLPAVVQWLGQQGITLQVPVSAELISGGRSNLTFLLTDADRQQVVLRRPPLGGVLATAHDMSREWRFMTALGPTAVPVPDVLATTAGPEPLGVPCYAMGYVEGLILHNAPSAESLNQTARSIFATNLVDTMAALHAVDIDEVGLAGIGKREDYIARQLRRWKRQWDQSGSTNIVEVDAAHDRLWQRIPEQTRATIVHGDFRPGNMICGPAGEVRAVLDWELATLGDPLADLAWLLTSWVEAHEWSGRADEDAPPSVLPGFPGRRWLLDRYQQRSGADVTSIDFYLAFCSWRSACIAAGVLARYVSGAMGDDGFNPAGVRAAITARARDALRFLERVG